MKRTLAEMVREFRQHWKNYVLQSVLATLTLFVALHVFSFERGIVVASLGASAFIVFAMPDSLTARASHVVGGHCVGLVCGLACLSISGPVANPPAAYAVAICAVAVGLSIFVMVVTDTEHPPAAGTALGVVMMGCSWRTALGVIASAALLAVAHRVLRRYLRDLA